MLPTKNDIPEKSRKKLVVLMNERLADTIDLQTQCKQAHWNIKGEDFIALHKLFDEINEDVEEYIDLVAERVVQLGGLAEGTARMVAKRSSLKEYGAAQASASKAHIKALSDALSSYAKMTRKAIDETDELEDKVSADMFTEITRGIDKWLWFVEAHLGG